MSKTCYALPNTLAVSLGCWSGHPRPRQPPDAQDHLFDDITARRGVGVGDPLLAGCRSWYQDPRTGCNTLLWPRSTLDFWRRTRTARRADYHDRARFT
jgi:hypothetical protein